MKSDAIYLLYYYDILTEPNNFSKKKNNTSKKNNNRKSKNRPLKRYLRLDGELR